MTIPAAETAQAVAAQPLAGAAPLWPWVEANQGLLPVLALAAAFGIAAWEIRQSVRRDRRALAAYIDWVLSCADRAIELTDDVVRYIDSGGEDDQRVSPAVWSMLKGNALGTLEEIQPMRPTHPELTHFVNRLIRCMAAQMDIDLPTPEIRRRLDDYKTYVVIHRDHVARFRPRTLGDRLQALLRRGPAADDLGQPWVASFR